MRSISATNLNTPTATTATTTTSKLAPAATVTPSSSIATTTTHSLWNSPIPYLFGGLAAMLCLIAFALLILAYTYRRLTGQLQNQDSGNRDLEKESDPQKKEPNNVYEENIFVIMAGDEKPTFLATPVCPKSLSFGVGVGSNLDKQLGDREVCDKSEKEMNNNHVVVGGSSTQENEGYQETQQQQQSQ